MMEELKAWELLGRIKGLSAYEDAVAHGFDGTFDEWVDTLKIKGDTGLKGDTGNGIESIEKTAQHGLTDTYTIAYTNGNTKTIELRNRIDTVMHDYTSELTDKGYAYTAMNRDTKQRGEVGEEASIYLHSNGVTDFGYSAVTTYLTAKIPVGGGQLFRLTAGGTANFPTFVIIGNNNIIKAKAIDAVENYLIEIEEDGWLLINDIISKEPNPSIIQTTIFHEVNESLKTIPTVEEVADKVLESLPKAEEGAF